MEKAKAVFKNAWPYQKDKMNLPVKDLDSSIPFYTEIMGFLVISRNDTPYKSATMERDAVQIGIAENGGDPEQDGCFFEVDNAENTFAEFKSNGLKKDVPGFGIEKHGDTSWTVFYVVAPDGLCYCLGEKHL